ncbi:MAG: integrase core domain-containing protein [Acidobacteriota bacterium]
MAMKIQSDYEKRCQAIQLYKQGKGPCKILQWIHRSKSRRSAFSGIGAEVIHWELQQRRVRHIPSISTKGEPGRNASVESFNNLWQDRVLRRHRCPTRTVLKRKTDQFLRYYHYEKPHRSLTQKEHGTRFPGVLRDRLWTTLRHLPEGFTLEQYMDAKHHLNLLVARGKVSFVRKVDPHGRIEVNGATYFIRRKLEGQCVIATVVTHRGKLVSNMKTRLSNHSLFQLEVQLLIPCFHWIDKKYRLVHDVIGFLSIRI